VDLVREQKRSLFGKDMTPGLVLSVEIGRNIYWKGRLIVFSATEAVYPTNCPNLLHGRRRENRNAPSLENL
jgi:hypothetical protein